MTRRYSRYKSYQYDSKWEQALNEGIFKDYEYHPQKIAYEKPATAHTYQPDWVLRQGEKVVYVEAKGRFREAAEAKKYIYIRDALKASEELVFLFWKASNPMPNAKARKDGTKRSHAEWAEKEGFRWFDEQSIERLLK